MQFRPTFSVELKSDPDEVLSRIRRSVLNEDDQFVGQFRSGHAMISIAESRRHFWSPWLHLDVRKSEQGINLIGRFSPHPTVWTAIIFANLGLSVLFFFSLVAGVSQQLADELAWGYYVAPVWLLIAGLLFVSAQVGQRLAHDEMESLKHLVTQHT